MPARRSPPIPAASIIPRMNLPTNLKIADVPFQPWARAVYKYRQATTTKDDPHVRCKPSGGPRMFHTPYGMEFLDLPEQQRVIIVGVGGPHTWRTIYMDGRAASEGSRSDVFGSFGRQVGRRFAGDRYGRIQREILADAGRHSATPLTFISPSASRGLTPTP